MLRITSTTISSGASKLYLVDAREQFWEEIASSGFGQLAIDGKRFDPFEVEAINVKTYLYMTRLFNEFESTLDGE